MIFSSITFLYWFIPVAFAGCFIASVYPGSRVYFAAIPDKSIYSGRYYPGYDPEEAAAVLQLSLKNAEIIDITDALTASTFYKIEYNINKQL